MIKKLNAGSVTPCWIVNPFSIPLPHESLRATGGKPWFGGKDSSESCDEKGITSQKTGTGSDLGALVSGLRYEYDGLNLLRVDEIYGASLSESGPWRTVEVSTHRTWPDCCPPLAKSPLSNLK